MNRKLIAFTLMLVTSLILLSGCSVYETQTGSSDNTEDEQTSAKTVTINLNVNGGEQLERSIFIGNAGDPMSLPTPKRDGYTFDKWYNGYDLIDQNVYPDTDMELTARWFALNDTEKSFSFSTPLNQQYNGGYKPNGTKVTIDFSEESSEQIIYLKKNYDIECTFSLSFEAYVSDSIAAPGLVRFTGANVADVIIEEEIPNKTTEYTLFTFSNTKQSRILIGDADGQVLKLLLIQGNSTFARLYVRNIVIEVNYTERKGSWV